jgi:regulatory protein
MAKIYDKKSAKVKIEQYCAYQERSQQEVRDKLYEMGLHQKEVEELISELITSNFLNEERFAIAYAGGKFRMKQWGKIKIKQHLKLKKVSDYCIKKALSLISEPDYDKTIQVIIDKKSNEIKEKDPYILNHKIARHLASKGFEAELIWEKLRKLDD